MHTSIIALRKLWKTINKVKCIFDFAQCFAKTKDIPKDKSGSFLKNSFRNSSISFILSRDFYPKITKIMYLPKKTILIDKEMPKYLEKFLYFGCLILKVNQMLFFRHSEIVFVGEDPTRYWIPDNCGKLTGQRVKTIPFVR